MTEHTMTHTIRSARGLYLRGVGMWVTPCKMPYNRGVFVTETYRHKYPTLDALVYDFTEKMCNAHDGRYLKFYTVHISQ